jgi:hypothetical protein
MAEISSVGGVWIFSGTTHTTQISWLHIYRYIQYFILFLLDEDSNDDSLLDQSLNSINSTTGTRSKHQAGTSVTEGTFITFVYHLLMYYNHLL